jgi:GST-like protein
LANTKRAILTIKKTAGAYMIELYGSPTQSTYAIAIMLEETGLPYSIFSANNSDSEQLDLDLLKQTPNNIFPVILDREGPHKKPYVIFETAAILTYLAEKSGQLLPTDAVEKCDALQWLLFENSKVAPTLSNLKHFLYHAPEEVPYAVKRFSNEAKRIFSIIENQLSENDFLAGEYSIADIATYPWIKEYERFGIAKNHIPCTIEWLDRINERSATNKGLVALENLKEAA